MKRRILIIGGYGNFGRYISKTLAPDTNIQIIIAGRSLYKAQQCAARLPAMNPVETACLNIHSNFFDALAALKPDLVIHTSGPFQAQNYNVAECCIEAGVHYIDLADGREFVKGISTLNTRAKKRNVLVISGASSVPCLTSAVIDHYLNKFERLESLDYGITTAQKTTRGLATTAAILSYTGKPFKTLINGNPQVIYGWQGLRLRKYKKLGWRLLANCDIPDLVLFPERYPHLKNLRFYAGLELFFIHLTLWLLSWLVRFGLIKHLEKSAALLLRLSFLFDWLGTANSAFHMKLSGKDHTGNNTDLTFELTAHSGDGPYIPCMPAIILARKIVNNQLNESGAYPCVGFISLDEYLHALNGLAITWDIS